MVCLPLSSSSLCSLENIFCSLPPPEAHDGRGVWRVRMVVGACNEMWRPALTATLVKLHRRSILTSLYVASPAASAYGSISTNFSISCLLDTKSNLFTTSCQNVTKIHLAKPAVCWFSWSADSYCAAGQLPQLLAVQHRPKVATGNKPLQAAHAFLLQ